MLTNEVNFICTYDVVILRGGTFAVYAEKVYHGKISFQINERGFFENDNQSSRTRSE